MTARMLLLPIFVAAAVAFAGCSQSVEPPPNDQPAPPEDVPPIDVPPEDLKALVDGNNQFAIDLYKKLAEKDGNIVFSPYSISSALAMTYAGARGQTAEEMAKVLHFTLTPERLHPAFGGVTRNLGRDGQVRIANSLWGQRGVTFESAFLGLLREGYSAGLRETDFMADPDGSRRAINGWVEEKTERKIKDLLGPNDVTKRSRLVLANAVYFKGQWEQPFNPAATVTDKFRVSETQSTPIKMMNMPGRFNYAEADGVQILYLPYRATGLAMLIALPRANDGLMRLEGQLNDKLFRSWSAAVIPLPGTVSIPTMQMNTGYGLKEHLSQLGMPLPFSSGADFSPMSLDHAARLAVSDVIHKAVIEVNEEGTVAAAATATVMNEKGSSPTTKPFVFRADHPFLFFIYDGGTDLVLFMGRFQGS